MYLLNIMKSRDVRGRDTWHLSFRPHYLNVVGRDKKSPPATPPPPLIQLPPKNRNSLFVRTIRGG
jgi:hypothetical protein